MIHVSGIPILLRTAQGVCWSWPNRLSRVALVAVLIGISTLPYSVRSQSVEVRHLFDVANEQYEKEQYEQAIENYQRVLALGFESVELYYNLGNAYYRAGRIGEAILNLERARRLAPKDEDVLHNLKIVGLRVVDKVPEPPRMIVQVWFAEVRDSLSLDQWTRLLLILYTLTAGFVILRILSRNSTLRNWSKRLIFVSVALLVLTSLVWAGSLRASSLVQAVILKDRVEVRSAPQKDATEVFPLHEGARVQVRSKVGEWCEIRLPDGKVGWVRKNVLEEI